MRIEIRVFLIKVIVMQHDLACGFDKMAVGVEVDSVLIRNKMLNSEPGMHFKEIVRVIVQVKGVVGGRHYLVHTLVDLVVVMSHQSSIVFFFVG